MVKLNRGVREIADNLFMITLPMPFRLQHVNVYALAENGRLVLFDTGPNFPETLPALDESLKGISRSVADIGCVLITHFHADHCGIAGRIQEQSHGKVCMSQIDDGVVHAFADSDLRLQRISEFCLEHGLDRKTIETLAGFFRDFKEITYPFRTDCFLADGEEIRLGNKTVRVIATPGHSRGHISFFIPGDGILLAGDNVLPHITPNLSPDIMEPSFRPLKSFMQSLDRIGTLPVRLVCPAHGSPFPDLKSRLDAIREHHRERKALTLRALGERPKTCHEVSIDVFGKDLPDFDKLLALNETYVHLIELEEESLIKRTREGGVVFFALK